MGTFASCLFLCRLHVTQDEVRLRHEEQGEAVVDFRLDTLYSDCLPSLGTVKSPSKPTNVRRGAPENTQPVRTSRAVQSRKEKPPELCNPAKRNLPSWAIPQRNAQQHTSLNTIVVARSSRQRRARGQLQQTTDRSSDEDCKFWTRRPFHTTTMQRILQSDSVVTGSDDGRCITARN